MFLGAEGNSLLIKPDKRAIHRDQIINANSFGLDGRPKRCGLSLIKIRCLMDNHPRRIGFVLIPEGFDTTGYEIADIVGSDVRLPVTFGVLPPAP